MGLLSSKYDNTAAGAKDVRTVNMSQLRELGERCYLHLDQLEIQAEASEAALRLQQNLLLNILDENQKRRTGTLPKADTSSQPFPTDLSGHGSYDDGAKANILDECDHEVHRQHDTLIGERLEIVLRDSREIVLRQAQMLRNSFELFKGFIEDKLEKRPSKQEYVNTWSVTQALNPNCDDYVYNAANEQTHSQRLHDGHNIDKETIHTLEKKLFANEHRLEQTCNLLKSFETEKQSYEMISKYSAREIEKKNLETLKETSNEIETLQNKNKELKKEHVTLKRKIQGLEEENRNLNRKVSQLENERQTFNRQDTYQYSSSGARWYSPRKSAVAQLYCPGRGDLTNVVSSEVTSMLTNQFLTNQTDLSLISCENATQLSPDKPGIVLCINASRLGTDVYNALQGVNVSHRLALVILHHKDLHALPNQPSDRVLTSPEYKALGGIFDMAFLSGKGIYPCDMNNTAVASIMHFIRHNNNL